MDFETELGEQALGSEPATINVRARAAVRRSVLQPGRNCWRSVKTGSGRFLIDGEAYFQDLFENLFAAQKKIFISGWDLCSRLELVPSEFASGKPRHLAPLLNFLAATRPELQIYILVWDAFPFFAAFRENKKSLQMAFRHSRIHLAFHAQTPVFASFHQKIVMIDDVVAYCGGIDLTSDRCDSPAHRFQRRSVARTMPIHDVQIKLEGEIVADFAELASTDWARATGHALPLAICEDPKPEKNNCEFQLAPMAVSLTRSIYRRQPKIREIEKLIVDLMGEARQRIYIECQYFSSKLVEDALVRALRVPDGPEVVIVTSRLHHGWWEQRTLGVRRNQVIERLRAVDHFKRFGIYWPEIADSPWGVQVHSKLIIIDDLYALIGSPNLTNRSLGLDSECALTIDATADFALRSVISGLQTRLLAEHLGASPLEMKTLLGKDRSILKLIRSRSGFSRTLQPIFHEPERWPSRWFLGRKWSDPPEPLRPEKSLYRLVQMILPKTMSDGRSS